MRLNWKPDTTKCVRLSLIASYWPQYIGALWDGRRNVFNLSRTFQYFRFRRQKLRYEASQIAFFKYLLFFPLSVIKNFILFFCTLYILCMYIQRSRNYSHVSYENTLILFAPNCARKLNLYISDQNWIYQSQITPAKSNLIKRAAMGNI